jgi:hypothetical protein
LSLAPVHLPQAVLGGNMDIRDEYGNRTGRVDDDGTIRDQYGNRTSRVDDDGTIRDEYGNRTGRVD